MIEASSFCHWIDLKPLSFVISTRLARAKLPFLIDFDLLFRVFVRKKKGA